jgi:hypothetical protein
MLRLDDYGGYRYEYTLDPATGQYARHRMAWNRKRAGPSGYASEERLKDPVRGNAKILVAIYTDGQRLLFAIHNEVFVISQPGVRIRVEKPGLLRRRVWIVDRERVVFDALFSWSWLEMSTWPADGDIFHYARWCTGSREGIFRLVYYWQAAKEARSTRGRAFQDEVQQYVTDRLAAEANEIRPDGTRGPAA